MSARHDAQHAANDAWYGHAYGHVGPQFDVAAGPPRYGYGPDHAKVEATTSVLYLSADSEGFGALCEGGTYLGHV